MSTQSKISRRGRPRSTVQETPEGKPAVLALDRGVRVLIHLAEVGPRSLTELSNETHMPAATCHRILSTLQARGMVNFDEITGNWMIGARAYLVGQAYRVSHGLLELALPVMQRLSKETGETSNLAIEDDGELLYLAQVESDNPIRASIKNGADNFFHTSGVGKAILAFTRTPRLEQILGSLTLAQQTRNSISSPDAFQAELSRTRDRGWALDDEERFIGMRCIAAPIFDSAETVVAGISISGPSIRFEDHKLDTLAKQVLGAAKEVSINLRSIQY